MTILGLEFSTEQRSVAVLHKNGLVRTGSDSRAVGGLSLVEQALQGAGLEREKVDCIAVGLGPGSYTGVRSAIAVVQGWQLARQVRLLGVSTVDCLAEQARAVGWHGRVDLVIDAQRHEFYLGIFEISDGGARALEPLRLAKREEIERRARAGQLIAGPEVQQWLPSGRGLVPDAAVIAKLAAGRSRFASGEELEPIYLREVNFVKAPPPRIL